MRPRCALRVPALLGPALLLPALLGAATPATAALRPAERTRHLLVTLAPSSDALGRTDQSASARARALGFSVRPSTDGATLDISGPASLVTRTFGTREVTGALPAAPLGAGAAGVLDPEDETPVFHQRSGMSAATIASAYASPTATTGVATPASTAPIVATIQFSTWDSASLTRFAQVDGLYADHTYDPVASGQWTNVAVQQLSSGSNCQTTNLDDDGAVEVVLDQEAILGVAPNLRQRTYTAGNTGSCALSAYKTVLTDVQAGLPIVALSTSWGACEKESSGLRSSLEPVLAQLAAAGVTITAASGDAGKQDCSDGSTGSDYPAASPSVLAMSATRIIGGGQPDTAWNTSATSATGGGYSGADGSSGYTPFSRPAWQSTVTLSGNTRLLPDLAVDGDPATGLVLEAVGSSVCGSPTAHCSFTVGGTSLSAPLMAAMVAGLAARHGSTGVGLLQPTLYAHPELFTDVSALSSTSAQYTWPVGAGFDEATGLGTPDLTKLEAVLWPSGTSSPSPGGASTGPSGSPAPSPTPTRSAAPTPGPTLTAGPDATTTSPSSSTVTRATAILPAGYSGPTSKAIAVARAVGVSAGKAFKRIRISQGFGLTSGTKTATVTIRFVGTGIDLHFAALRTGGRAKITVDGRSSKIDLYSAKAHDRLKAISGLRYGKHRVAIQVLGTHAAASQGHTVRLTLMRVRATGAVRAL